ncbi:SMC family ATPase [Candidatus Woesearchaeota archaeon]|nr:SMC family ATPase [Candidatus Woesearchaeota archaeon]
MIIKSIKLHNIRSYLSQEIEFPEGSVLLSGDIGSGKSTILLAIEFALFGISRGLLSSEALLRHGKQSGLVELRFLLDGKEVIIQRNLKRLKDSIRQDEGFLIIDGIKQFCTADELKARVLDMLGYPKELLRKSKGLIYRFTVYTPQEEMKRILFEDPQARLDTLRRVFQVEKYKLVRDGAVIVMQALREKKRELSARIEDLPSKQQQLQQLSDSLAGVDKKIAALIPDIDVVQKRLLLQQESLKAFEEKSRQLNSLKSQLAATTAVIEEKKGLIRLKESEIAAAKKEISSLKSVAHDNSTAAGQLSSALSRLQSFSNALLSEVENKKHLEDELTAAEQLKSELEAWMGRDEAMKSSSLQLQQKISTLSKCPTCLQHVSDGHKHKISSEEEAKVAELNVKLIAAAEKKATAVQKIKSLKAELSGLQAKEKAAAALVSELKPYFELASIFDVAIQPQQPSYSTMAVAEMQSELNSLAAAKKKLESSKEKLFIVAEKERLIFAAEKSAESSLNELQLLEAKKIELAAKIGAFGDVEADMIQLQAALDKIANERVQLMMQKASLDKEKESFADMARLLSDEISRKEAAKKELDESSNLNYWLEEMFINLVGVIERHVMMKVHQEFNGLFKEWFVMLMGNETLTARVDDDFTPVVEADGFEIPVENLSGGEKTSCALAYRLALNMVINNLVSTIRTNDLLILDEPTDGFSAEQLNKLRDVLVQLQLPQIIVVSHEERIESFVQSVIRIQKEQHVSRVVA